MLATKRLAARYAQAFLNLTELEYNDVKRIEQAGTCLTQHSQVLVYMKIPLKDDSGLIKAIEKVLARYKIKTLVGQLVALLVRDARLALLPFVLQAIANRYRCIHNICRCTVTSASPLSKVEKSHIEKAIAQKLKVTPEVSYEVDEQLVAGIRIEAGYFLWEDSVVLKLRSLSSTVLEEVYRG